jgi:tetratricopeptide (TPR) repeat protein
MRGREAAAGLVVWLLAAGALSMPGLPGRADAQGRSLDLTIQFFEARVARDPGNSLNYAKLGAAYIQKARETGDVTYHERAETALKKALELGPDPRTATTAATQLAQVYAAKHQFQDALAQARKALADGTGQLFPYAIIGDAYLDLGDYDQASAAYSMLRALTGPAYPHSRLAHLHFLKGNSAAAIQEMERGVEALAAAHAPSENVAWTQARLGELFFQVGNLERAARAYLESAVSHSGYHRAQAGLAKVRAAEARYPEAIELYRKALAVIPLGEYAAGLGDVYAKTGRADEARKQFDLVEYIGLISTLNKVIYNRELALFYADHDLKLPRALELAERELEVRRDIYTYDVLAWALYKNGRIRDAVAPMTEALKLGTKDARLFFHAGLIYQAIGNAGKAREYLHRALATNRHFHILQADVAARTLKDLGGPPGEP